MQIVQYVARAMCACGVLWTTPGSPSVLCACGASWILGDVPGGNAASCTDEQFKAAVAGELRVDETQVQIVKV